MPEAIQPDRIIASLLDKFGKDQSVNQKGLIDAFTKWKKATEIAEEVAKESREASRQDLSSLLKSIQEQRKELREQDKNQSRLIDGVVDELQELRKENEEEFNLRRKAFVEETTWKKKQLEFDARERKDDLQRTFSKIKMDKEFYDLGFKKDRQTTFLQKMFEAKKSGKSFLGALTSATTSTLYEKTLKDTVRGIQKVYTAATGKATEGGMELFETWRSEQERLQSEEKKSQREIFENSDESIKLRDRIQEKIFQKQWKLLDMEEKYKQEIYNKIEALGSIKSQMNPDTKGESKLPHFATGGIVDQAKNGVTVKVAENEKEVISPLSKLPNLLGLNKQTNKSSDPNVSIFLKDISNLLTKMSSGSGLANKDSSFTDEVQTEADEQFRSQTLHEQKINTKHLDTTSSVLKDVANPTSHTAFTVRMKTDEQKKEITKKSKDDKSSLKDMFGGSFLKMLGGAIPFLLAGAGVAAAAGTLYASITATKAREELKENTIAREKHLRKGGKDLATIEEKRLGMEAGSMMKGLGSFEGAEQASKGLNVEQLQSKREEFQRSTTITEDRVKQLERSKKLHQDKGILGTATDSIFGMGFSGKDQKELESLQKEVMAKKASIGAIDAQLLEEKKKGIQVKTEVAEVKKEKTEGIKAEKIERIPKETINRESIFSLESVPELMKDLISLVKSIGGDYTSIVKTGIQKATSSSVAMAAALPTGTVDNVKSASGGVYAPAMSTMKS